MNLAAIRTAMYAQADWSPDQSPQALSRVTGFINRAYNQLALEAPFLFFEDKLRVTTEPDVASASDNDTLTPATTSGIDPASADPWVFKTNYTKTVADADTDELYTTTWKTDRSWDGRVIEFELADGTFLRNQIRTVWLESDRWHLTLVHPFDQSRPSSLWTPKFRIYTEAYAFPDDLIELRSMRLASSTQQYPLNIIGQDEAEELILIGPRSRVASGIPRIVFRREHFQLEGPGLAPQVALDLTDSTGDGLPTNPWKGPEPPGEFEYVVTYTWGKRDAEFRLPGLAKWNSYAAQWSNTDQTIARTPTHNEFADNRVREPRYESAPSPVSGKVSVEIPTEVVDQEIVPLLDAYSAVILTVPNIEYALGFLTQHNFPLTGFTGERASQHQSGIHVRIYRRRVSTLEYDPSHRYANLAYDAKGLNSDGVVYPDNKQKFYLLAEMRIDELNTGRFIDDGQYIPDRSRPLRDTHGYQQYGVYPRPDARYEVDVRCLRRPQKLVDEQDAPRIHAEATDMLINRAMAYLYESMGDYAASQLMMTRYEEGRQTLAKRYGDMRPVSRPVLRRMTRAKSSGRSRGNYRKWNTVISEGDI